MVRFGIVGLGRLGYEHAHNLKYNVKDASLNAICSYDEEQLNQLSKEWNVSNTYLSLEDMLQSGTIDAVLICSPSEFHYEHIKMVLDAGCHVFSEKPLALNVEDAQELVTYVDQYPKQKFMLGFMRRFDPAYREAKALIDEGVIGEPYFFRGVSLDPQAEIEGFLKFAKGADSGGIFMDLSIHDFDLARWYLDKEGEKVWSLGGSYRNPQIDELGDAEVASAMMQFENEKMATFLASRSCSHGYHVETEIIGTHGTLQIGKTPTDTQIVILDKMGIQQDVVQGFISRFKEAYREELNYFVSCIQNDKYPEVGAIDGLQSIRMANAAKKSYISKEIEYL